MATEWIDFKTVKQRVSMVMVLQRYGIHLRQSGKELRGPCPIHNGKGTDTLHVNPEKNIFQCFSCRAKGNVLDFVAAIERCSVRDAAQRLSDWFVVQAEVHSAADGNRAGPTGSPEPDSESANRPLGFRLRGIDSSHAYLGGRGIDPATAEYFGVGFFPGGGSMSGRIVIPIEDEAGSLVAYAGRSVDHSEPKYKFPAGFRKSHVLYNLVRAREEATAGLVVVVEGFFDCMKVTQAEYACVALMGCSISEQQEQLLAKHFKRVVLLLDGDEAGRRGAIEIAGRLATEVYVRIVDVGDGKQPDQLSAEQLRNSLASVLA